MGSEEGDGMANVDAASSWQQYYTWCGSYSHPHSHSHPHGGGGGGGATAPVQPHTHSSHHPHFHHPNHLNQYQGDQYQQQSLAASSAANASAHYSTSQQYHLQLQPAQTPPLHQQQQFHPVRGQTVARRAAPYDRTGIQCTTFPPSCSLLTSHGRANVCVERNDRKGCVSEIGVVAVAMAITRAFGRWSWVRFS
ncbi:hypothetical protein WH47_00130 [Habropoda laboriosa]|uniref:Uncharacterized protein n=1 Tax=Habropoda laboriosa TaxID=597456 RepID=A0A0L7R8R6_9HYME|nr:hypothetical protein WH47_00130 [Habropoda laboriosa]